MQLAALTHDPPHLRTTSCMNDPQYPPTSRWDLQVLLKQGALQAMHIHPHWSM